MTFDEQSTAHRRRVERPSNRSWNNRISWEEHEAPRGIGRLTWCAHTEESVRGCSSEELTLSQDGRPHKPTIRSTCQNWYRVRRVWAMSNLYLMMRQTHIKHKTEGIPWWRNILSKGIYTYTCRAFQGYVLEVIESDTIIDRVPVTSY